MSTPPPVPAASAALLALRERYRASAAHTIVALSALAAQLAPAPHAPELLEALRRELHRLHGTAGSYGFMEASRLAARFDERAARWVAEPGLEVHQRAAAVEHFAASLRAAFDAEGTEREP